MENTQKVQELIYQFKYLKDQRDIFQSQFDIMNASLGNLINTKNTIENLKSIKVNEEILIPIGGIINMKAIIKEPQKVLLYVSQDVVIEKDLNSSIEFIDRIIEQHQEQINFIRTQVQKIDINLQGMSQTIQKGMQQK